MIHFDKVLKAFRRADARASDRHHVVLDHVDLAVEQGECVVLTGASGAGKSTLLGLVAALDRPDGGSVRVGQQAVDALRGPAVAWYRRKLGLILQDRRLLDDRPAIDNVMLPLLVTGAATGEARQRAQAALERVGLGERAREYPVGLSGGEQQRLAIARAIVNRPALILADEPTAHLDPDNARRIAEIFRDFNRAGVTVLIATHDPGLMSDVPGIVPRCLHLEAGRVEALP